MRRQAIRAMLAFLFSSFWLSLPEMSQCFSQTNKNTPALVERTDKIDSYITREMQARRIPGLALAVVEHGKVVLKKAYGIANLETDTPVKTNSIFELASITKQFTATAIMILVEEGKVRLEDSINTYIDHTPNSWKEITVRHLLTHTAGLSGAIVRYEGSPLLDISTRQAFDFIARSPLLFLPGERASYSDAGYVLLGMVIEKAAGQPYREFMQKRIFDPLQMTDSSILDKWKIIKRRVPTYTIRNGELANWRRDWQYEMPSFFGIFSTVEDLARWDAALLNGTLLKKPSLEQMWTPATLNKGQEALVNGQPYGFGWSLGDIRGHRIAAHSGASGTFILRFLDDALTVVVLTNLDVASGPHASVLARGIAGLVRPEYQLPEMIPPQSDPAPQTTESIRRLLSEMAEEKESSLMTSSHQAFFNNLPPSNRKELSTQLKGLKSLIYIVSDNVEGRAVKRLGETVTRIIYYKGMIGERTWYFIFWLTKEGKVAYLRFYPA